MYPAFRWTHITCVLFSGTLFVARGIGVLRGATWAMQLGVRRASVLIDSALLSAALMMLYTLQLNPFTVGWLATKLYVLVLYIVLGTFALKRARTPRGRFVCFLASVLCLGFIVSVARAHHPLGVFLNL